MNGYSDAKISDRANDTLTNNCQKKVLYFSDGTLEVDDLDGEPSMSSANLDCKSAPVNPRELPWMPWMLYQTTSVGLKALEVCDYFGESLASFFGITTPKYQFELNEFHRLKKEEEEEIKKDIEMGHWTKKFGSAEIQETGNGSAISTEPRVFNYK